MHEGRIESAKLLISQAMDTLKMAVDTIRDAQQHDADEDDNGRSSKNKDSENGQ